MWCDLDLKSAHFLKNEIISLLFCFIIILLWTIKTMHYYAIYYYIGKWKNNNKIKMAYMRLFHMFLSDQHSNSVYCQIYSLSVFNLRGVCVYISLKNIQCTTFFLNYRFKFPFFRKQECKWPLLTNHKFSCNSYNFHEVIFAQFSFPTLS